MFIVRVMPIARGIFKDYLTFFSRENIAPGSVVLVPVRGRSVSGLVIESRDAREEKFDLRSANFALKKISTHAKAKRIFTNAFIASVKDTALWHGVYEGIMFGALVSDIILKAGSKLEPTGESISSKNVEEKARMRSDLLILQAESSERVRTYRNLAREAFARGQSLVILAPTIIEAETLARELARGIEEHVLLMTSEVPKKKLIESWNRCITAPIPLLVVGTAFALSLPRTDIDSVVVERESARSYRARERPHVDVRRAAEFFCRKVGARLILADFPVRVETRYRVDVSEMDELARSQLRQSGAAETRIVDTRKKDETRGEKRIFTTLTADTKRAIEKEIAKGGRAIVFAARRGLAPLTVCNDCGTPVTDPDTGMPMVLHKTSEGNVFMSHRSGRTLPGETPCKNCGGWNLVTLGIGVERVGAELAKAFPKTPLMTFTADSAPTHRSAKKIAQNFFSTKGALLVGTERMLPYLGEPVEIITVASVDSILSLSAWRAEEHALSILFYLRERAELAFIVETRKPENQVMKTLRSGNPTDFYRTDILERERYNYPPFTTFIGIVCRGAPARVEKNRLFIKETFSDTDLVGPLPPVQTAKTEWSARAVIRMPRGEWPNAELVARLRALPPEFEVTVDPDEIV